MFPKLKQLFSPPNFQDEEKNRIANILNTIILTILPISLGLILFTTAVGVTHTPLVLLSAFLLLVIAYVFLKRSQLKAASIILITTMLMGVTSLLILGYGIHDEAVAILPIIIILASLLFTDFLFYLFSGLVILMTGCVTWLDYSGLIDTGFPPQQVLYDYVLLVGILVVTAVTIRVLSLNLKDSLNRAREIEGALRENEEIAHQFQQKLRALQAVNIQLQHIADLDELFEQAITLGHSKLGFERLGLILYDAEANLQRFTFGTNKFGDVYDERHIQVEPGENYSALINAKERWLFIEDADLWSGWEVVGKGWNGIAILWNGDEGIGWLASDNLLSKSPPPAYLPELQTMYADILGHLITRLRTEKALRENEASARMFQEQLQALHEVSIELAQINGLDDLFYQAIQKGRDRLRFERLGLLLFEPDSGMMYGTFGTDDKGNIVDERDFSYLLDENSSLYSLLSKQKRVNFIEDAVLYSRGNAVGRGWRATSVLWNGREGIGWLSTDNFLSGTPPHPNRLEILSLYGATLGNLITRLRANLALEQEEQEARTFQEKLQILHEVSLDLAGVDKLDELYQLVIEHGRARLDFDRLGLFLYDRDTKMLQGVWGTDPNGQLIDESHYKQDISDQEVGMMLDRKERLVLWEDVVLTDSEGPVGRGWNAMAVLWNGKEGVGILAADNLIKQEPVSPMQLEILTLYGATIGYLITLKQSEEALKAYAKELERSNQELQEFAYVSSHDLQEPLRKIQTFSDRLSTAYSTRLDVRGQDYLYRMQDAASRMQALIQDLLAFSRVNTQALPFGPVELNQILEEVLTDLEIRIEETGARLSVDELPVVQADRTQMHQLFQNLISNALKFHRPEVPPVIEISCQFLAAGEKQADHYQIVVKDNGIGFEDIYNERIFAVFQRLHGRSEFDGSGIGLAICRRIVERHGGQIEAQGRPNIGATFTIILPAS